MDIESNFNLGLLYLQAEGHNNKALKYFEASVSKDKPDADRKTLLYGSQFAKAYYNIGMIFDKIGDI